MGWYFSYPDGCTGCGGNRGCAFVGMLFFNRKLLGVSIPFYPAFEQVNVRFYVRRKLQQGWRQGVVKKREQRRNQQ
ncbi:MAG: DUF2071 domain-containing protein [Deltaproteobacteria bacterium]|nr:DUF2071 domain-containing protein [Deltaproteobacteria bacterium]